MSQKHALPPVLEMLGPKDSGKTTLARLFLEISAETQNVLVLDCSEALELANYYQLENPKPLLETLQPYLDQPLAQATQDWLMQEWAHPLPFSLNHQAELLLIGQPQAPFSPLESSFLAYALPRLLETCDLIVTDGPLGALKPFLSPFEIMPLLIIRPSDLLEDLNLASLQESLPDGLSILLSQAGPSDLPPAWALKNIQEKGWQLIGRIPALPNPDASLDNISQAFLDCFRHLPLKSPFEN